MTGKEIIRAALRQNGTIGATQEPTAADYAACLEYLNNLGDSWSAEGLLVFAFSRETFTLVAGQASYTLGPSGDFNTTRPAYIDSAQIRYPSSETDYDVEVVPQNQYDRLSLKTTQGRPYWLFYNPTMATGTVILGYVPDQAYTLRLNMAQRLGALTLAGEANFPPEYNRALVFNLAVDIAPMYEFEPGQTTLRIAKESKDVLVARNAANDLRVAEMDMVMTNSGRKPFVSKGAFLSGD